MYSITALVAAGLGIAVVPASVARYKVSHVINRRLSGRHPKAKLGLVVRSQDASGTAHEQPHTRRPSLRHLEEICREIFNEL